MNQEKLEQPRSSLIDPSLYQIREIQYPTGRNGCMRALLAKQSESTYSYLEKIQKFIKELYNGKILPRLTK